MAKDRVTIFLVGMMGAGKTEVGRALARRLAKRFFDTDAELERRADMTIAEIFSKKGEAAFRALESKLVAELATKRGIVSLGGGALLDPMTRKLAKPRVALKCSEPVLWKRLEPELPKRPLLKKGRPALKALLEKRKALYEDALFSVSTTRNSPAAAAKLIEKGLKKRGLL